MALRVTPNFDFTNPVPTVGNGQAHTAVRSRSNDLAPAKFNEYERVMADLCTALGDYEFSASLPLVAGCPDNVGGAVAAFYGYVNTQLALKTDLTTHNALAAIVDDMTGYDYVISTQEEFNAVFVSGTVLEDVRIFVEDKGSAYDLGWAMEMGNNLTIHSNGATVQAAAEGAVLFVAYESTSSVLTSAPTGNPDSYSGVVYTVDDVTPFSAGDVLDIYPSVYSIRVGDVDEGTNTFTGYVIYNQSIDGGEISGRIRIYKRNINLGGWTFDGRCGLGGYGGSYTTNGIYLGYCADSTIGITVRNCAPGISGYPASGGIGVGVAGLGLNITVSEIHSCKLGAIGLLFSRIDSIRNCTATGASGGAHMLIGCVVKEIDQCHTLYNNTYCGGGIGTSWWCNILKISNCSGIYGGGAASLSTSTVNIISNCSATYGGGIYGGRGVSIGTIMDCDATETGGAAMTLLQCHVGSIEECTAKYGGGLYNCDHTSVNALSAVTATAQGAAGHTLRNCDIRTTWDALASTSDGDGNGGGYYNCTSCTFGPMDYCRAMGNGGAAAYCTYCTFESIDDSSAVGGNGGGCYNCTYCTILNVRDCVGTGDGGGCDSCHCSTITGVYSCSADDGGNGGGVANSSGCVINTVIDCEATTSGGGVYNVSGAVITGVEKCTAVTGGGVANCNDSVISNVRYCTSTSNPDEAAGGAHNCSNVVLTGSWTGNVATTGSYNHVSSGCVGKIEAFADGVYKETEWGDISW